MEKLEYSSYRPNGAIQHSTYYHTLLVQTFEVAWSSIILFITFLE